ncbi:MAG: hypothetical protein BWY31_01216 [Lentisphaerae bacterium ADurb.Bin242]|nr:MAG: hypothetical protein BWY31_01216 [Lentisphaerae bacterium ADurb.Bin242]
MLQRMAFGILTFLSLFASGFDFADQGKPLCVIAIPEQMNQFENLALKDLQSYLEKMTGAPFSVVPENKVKGAAVYLGQTEYAKKHGVDFSKLGKEEWVLKESGNNLIIAGGRPIGTFYGVWALLNKSGCWSLSMEQDAVPKYSKLSMKGLNEQKSPRFGGRVIYDGFAVSSTIMGIPEKEKKAYQMYLLRNHINGKQHRLLMPLYLGDLTNVSTEPAWHTLCLYVDPGIYFKTHPEYFSMNEKGQRVRPHSSTAGGSLCMSNADVKRISLEKLRTFIKQDRKKFPKEEWPILYDISVLDLFPYICLCPECRAIVKEEGGGEFGLMMRYINFVAGEIAKEYPDILIRTLGYGLAKVKEAKTKPAKNVILQVADKFVYCDYFRPLSHKFNDPARETFEDCRKTGARLAVWDYWNMSMYFEPPRLETILDTLQPDMRYFAGIGVEALFLEAERHTYKPQNFIDLNYFIAAKLMVNPEENVDRLMDVFMNGYYGDAAPELKIFMNQLREGIKKFPKLQKGMSVAQWDYMTPEFLVESYKRLKKAAEKTPESSLQRRHVNDELLPLLWLVVEKRLRYEKVFRDAGIRMDTLKKECYDYSMAHLARYNGTKLDAHSPYAKTRKDFQEEFAKITNVPLPIPLKFAKVPEEKIRVFGKYHYIQKPDYYALVVKDPDSPTGEALKSANPNPASHGAETVVRDPKGKWAFRATEFGYGTNYVVVKNIPQDEKYHWYKMPKIKIDENGSFYGHVWYIHLPLGSAYRIDDGTSDENVWDCWFSAKFTGPAYVKGSKKENAVWLDTVVLVKEDAESLIAKE